MILRHAPTIYGKDIEKVIGAPQDYNTNKQNEEFPDSYDLKLPRSGDDEGNDRMEEETEQPMTTPAKQFIEEVKNEEPREEIMISAAKSERPAADYMPIKALNQFTGDWRIKARVLKKSPIKNWSNSKGTGSLINFDLIDKDGTMIQATAFHEQATQLDKLMV